jgi:hypothetical protein
MQFLKENYNEKNKLHLLTKGIIVRNNSQESIKYEYKDLVLSVLKWWKEHQFDTMRVGEDEENLFDEIPEMVKIAEKLAIEYKLKK